MGLSRTLAKTQVCWTLLSSSSSSSFIIITFIMNPHSKKLSVTILMFKSCQTWLIRRNCLKPVNNQVCIRLNLYIFGHVNQHISFPSTDPVKHIKGTSSFLYSNLFLKTLLYLLICIFFLFIVSSRKYFIETGNTQFWQIKA